MQVAKVALRCIIGHSIQLGTDLIRQCDVSADFHEGVAAFAEKTSPVWIGSEAITRPGAGAAD